MTILKRKYHKLTAIKTIAILADPACRPGWKKNFPRLLRKVWQEHKPDLFLVAGDLSLNATQKEYNEVFRYINKYPAVWAAVPGDHDYPTRNFRKYFGTLHKVIDIGGWRFIGLNTGTRTFSKKEAGWFSRQIRPRSIIFSHIPPEAPGWTFHSLWPRASNRFLAIVKKQRRYLHSMYFGHIHGYSRRVYQDIPLVVTGGIAESRGVKNNRYQGRGPLEMIIFKVTSGKTRVCKI